MIRRNALKAMVFTSLVAMCIAGAPALTDWKPANPSHKFSFPADHASHPGNRIEWWYYTGNLESSNGERFGYELTFFRVGVDPAPANPSRWAVRDLYMAHFAVSDLRNSKFRFAELLNRAGIGWAGALTEKYHVWNEDWSVELEDDGRHVLRAKSGGMAIDLTLESLKAPVLHGLNGYSQKGAQTGNASSYYSLTRMKTSGHLTVEGRVETVSGLSWMDHEFGSSFLEKGQTGWDWFALQFEDGSDLMFYSFRREDSLPDPRSSGTFVEPDGPFHGLAADEVVLEKRRFWTSKSSGAVYPVEWRLLQPSRAIDVNVSAAFDQQELHTLESTGVVYWEGAVKVTGTRGAKNVSGRGYLEMTGYSGQTLDRVLN